MSASTPVTGGNECSTAAAFRDIADMVETLGLDCQITASVRDQFGRLHVNIEPGHDCDDAARIRPVIDAIADYIGAPLRGSFSRGEFWHVGTSWEWPGRLPCGAATRVGQRLRGRPLDLAPLPERRRGRATGATRTDDVTGGAA